MPAPFGVSPSALARYFFHDCDRFLFHSPRNPSHEGIAERKENSGPVMAFSLNVPDAFLAIERVGLEGRLIAAGDRPNTVLAEASRILYGPRYVCACPKVAEGLAYMRGLVQLAQRRGQTLDFSLRPQARLQVVRLGAHCEALV